MNRPGSSTWNYYARRIPPLLLGPLEAYFLRGIPPDSFVRAVLENNLIETAKNADDWSMDYLKNICGLVYNCFPARSYGICWGSPDKVNGWIACGGLEGYENSQTEEDSATP